MKSNIETSIFTIDPQTDLEIVSISSSSSSEIVFTPSESSPSSSYFDIYTDDCLDDCPFCNPKYRDAWIAEAHKSRDDYLWIFEPYRDFRSAARAKRKTRENNGGCNSYRCRRQGQAEQRRRNKRARWEGVRFAVLESQTVVMGCGDGVKVGVVEWDV